MRLTHESNAAPLAGGARVDEVTVQVKPSVPFSFPPSHHNAPAGTSQVAAGRIASKARSLRAQVLAFLRGRGEQGATDQEAQELLGLPSNTQIPRRWELVKAGKVAASARRRDTRSGCPATVWVAIEFVGSQEVRNG